MTQAELAKQLGTHQPKISQFIHGKAGLAGKYALRLEALTKGTVKAKAILDPDSGSPRHCTSRGVRR